MRVEAIYKMYTVATRVAMREGTAKRRCAICAQAQRSRRDPQVVVVAAERSSETVRC